MDTVEREKFLHAALRKSAERFESERRERLAREIWLTRLLLAWGSTQHRTFGSFLRSRPGKTFRRRCYLALTEEGK